VLVSRPGLTALVWLTEIVLIHGADLAGLIPGSFLPGVISFLPILKRNHPDLGMVVPV
jgi:hypothetical protein